MTVKFEVIPQETGLWYWGILEYRNDFWSNIGCGNSDSYEEAYRDMKEYFETIYFILDRKD